MLIVISGLKRTAGEGRMKEVRLRGLEKRRRRRDLGTVFSYLKGNYGEDGAGLAQGQD